MKISYLLLLFFILGACNNDRSEKEIPGESSNDVDAAREFIRATLDGEFDKARSYLLPDSANTQYMDVVQRVYERTNRDTLYAYRSASIRMYTPTFRVNDSTTVVVFSNSYKNDKDTLKLVKNGDKWLVDLKYLYEHDMDTMRLVNDADTIHAK